MENQSLKINKTIKLYIGGQFPRTESGRSFVHKIKGTNKPYANVCQSSRKDFRNAVEAAKGAQTAWEKRAAFNRSQILYRVAEMIEGKKEEFIDLFKTTMGMTKTQATNAVELGRDAFVYYAGFCDKFQQVIGSINCVSGPFHNFSSPTAMGVVTLVESDEFDFQNLCASLAAIIASGNTVVAILGQSCPSVLAPLAEVLATSDLPGGVVNLLTGNIEELYAVIGGHREVQSVNFQFGSKEMLRTIKESGASNMKRIVSAKKPALCLERITDHVEIKSVWHPIGV